MRTPLLVCLIFGGLLWSGAAWAQPVPIRLAGADSPVVRPPLQPFEWSWDDAQVVPVWERLAFELDGMDVTALVVRRPGGALLTMPVPLARGAHQLRVVLSQGDGSLVEWGAWTVSIGGIPKVEGQGDVLLRLHQRVHNRGDLQRDAGSDTQMDGAARVSARRETDDSTTTFQAQVWTNSNQGSNINNNTADLGEYLIESDFGESQFRLGHHQLPYESLIHSGFQRRGASFSTALQPTVRLSGFAMRSEPVAGAYALSGVQEPQHRVSGLVYEHQLAASADSAYVLSWGLVGGEGDDLQANPAIASSQHKGSSVAVGGEASWVGRRLRLRGEIARSTYDWNANGLLPVSQSSDQDNAHVLALQYQSEAKSPGEGQWTTDLEHREVGSFFRSMANLGLPMDRRSDRVRTNWRAGEWQAGAGAMRQETNVASLANLPRIAFDQADMLVMWSPAYGTEPRRYGHPSVSATVSQLRQSQVFTPTGYLGTTVDNSSWQGNLNFSLAHERWGGQLGLGSGGFSNASLPNLSTRSRTVSLGGQWRSQGERLSVGPVMQWSHLQYVQTDQSDVVRSGSLVVDFAFVPDRFFGNLSIGLNQMNRTADSLSELSRYYVGELVWRLQKASDKRPGWDAKLSFSHQELNNSLYVVNTGYVQQVFLGLTMTWPVSVRP